MVSILIYPKILCSNQSVHLFFFLGCFAMSQLIYSPIARADESCASLLQSRCLSCHFETRICDKMKKKKGKGSWKRTIKSMIRHGAKLDKGEQKLLIQCLAGRDKAALSLCNMDK